ncbi:TPA: transcriptional regulator [Raoultella planticola]
MNKDITFGLPAEKERDLDKTMQLFKWLQSKHRPLEVTMVNGQSFRLCISGLQLRDRKIDMCTTVIKDKDNRVTLPVDYIASVEQILGEEIDTSHEGKLTVRRGDLEDEGYKPSGRDFFRIIRQAYQDGKNIRVYLCDNRIVEGESIGMDEQQVSVRLPEGKVIWIFYDWVDRILPIEKV